MLKKIIRNTWGGRKMEDDKPISEPSRWCLADLWGNRYEASKDGSDSESVHSEGWQESAAQSELALEAGLPSAAKGCDEAAPAGAAFNSVSVIQSDCRINVQNPSTDSAAALPMAAAALQSGAESLPLSSSLPPRICISKAELLQRFTKFLFGHEAGPVATDDGGVSHLATLELIGLVHEARVALWKEQMAAIKALWAPLPFSKQELLAFLLADALGKPLLDNNLALAVGQCGDNAVAKLKRELTAAKKAAYQQLRKAKLAADSNPELSPGIAKAQAAGTAAETVIYTTAYDLQLPEAPIVGSKRQRERLEPTAQELHGRLSAAERARNIAWSALEDHWLELDHLGDCQSTSNPERHAGLQDYMEQAGEKLERSWEAASDHLRAARERYSAAYLAERQAQAKEERATRAKEFEAQQAQARAQVAEWDQQEADKQRRLDALDSAWQAKLAQFKEAELQHEVCGFAHPSPLYARYNIWVKWTGREFRSSGMEWVHPDYTPGSLLVMLDTVHMNELEDENFELRERVAELENHLRYHS